MEMADKRREPRVDVSWPLRVAGINGRGDGRVVNISLCGLLFAVDADLEKGDLVVLRVGLDHDTTIDCVAQILRVDTQDDNRAYGADFRYLTAADRQKLSFALLLVQEPALADRLGSR